MSRNSKMRQRTVAAKARNRTKGYKGPAKTVACHGKKRAWFQLGNNNNNAGRKTKKDKDADA